jgi:hypothetical protein
MTEAGLVVPLEKCLSSPSDVTPLFDFGRSFPWVACLVALAWSAHPAAASLDERVEVPVAEYFVRTTADRGVGSLRQAVQDADRHGGPARIRFDAVHGPFGEPQVILLRSALPPIRTRLEIDGYIPDRTWRASGVTLQSAGKDRILNVAAGAMAVVRHVTLQGGRATAGGAVLNRGTLVLDSVTLLDNTAEGDGGAVLNADGQVTVVNATLTANSAARGGAVASTAGRLTITNTTFAGNRASEGASVYSGATLLLRNSILARGAGGGADCVNRGPLDPRSTHNLLAAADGCGQPLLTEDPRLGPLGYYNGPTRTLPLDASSPAVNVGSNAAALDEHDQPLQWDQRGNGDPRDAAGITDLGAFEVQAPTALQVDRADDVDRRACSRLAGDCSLRGAWHLANAGRLEPVIRFATDAGLSGAALLLLDPLPAAEIDLRIDGTDVPGLRLQLSDCQALSRLPARVTVTGIALLGPSGPCPQAAPVAR